MHNRDINRMRILFIDELKSYGLPASPIISQIDNMFQSIETLPPEYYATVMPQYLESIKAFIEDSATPEVKVTLLNINKYFGSFVAIPEMQTATHLDTQTMFAPLSSEIHNDNFEYGLENHADLLDKHNLETPGTRDFIQAQNAFNDDDDTPVQQRMHYSELKKAVPEQNVPAGFRLDSGKELKEKHFHEVMSEEERKEEQVSDVFVAKSSRKKPIKMRSSMIFNFGIPDRVESKDKTPISSSSLANPKNNKT